MELQKQVASLELSKRLKELGVKQESKFVWARYADETSMRWRDWKVATLDQEYFDEEYYDDDRWGRPISAFTDSELDKKLPPRIQCYPDGDMECCLDGENIQDGYAVFERTKANSRAKMLIYLIENKLITV